MKTILYLLFGFLAFAAITPVEVRSQGSPVVTVSAVDSTAVEGSDDAAMFVVRRSGRIQNPLRVFYLVGGNARNGLDYELVERSVVIPAGSREVTIEVAPLDDELLESTEFVSVQLKPAPRNVRKYRIGATRLHSARQATIGPGGTRPADPASRTLTFESRPGPH